VAGVGDRQSRAWIGPWLGAASVVGVFVFDSIAGASIVLVPLLVVGPLLAASSDKPSRTLWVGALAIAGSIPLGWIDEIGGTWRHFTGIAVNVAGTLSAWRLATARQHREDVLRHASPTLDRAARLALAMNAGKIGEWWWDIGSGRVGWDAQASALFGLEPDGFEGTYDAWLARVDERDRAAVVAAVEDGIARIEPFRFDHRCVWPDGSVHWLEGIGEVTVGEDGRPTGGVGLVVDVDERHRVLDERAHLTELERAARLRAEYVSRVQGVLATSVDTTEILQRVTQAIVPDLADWCTAVLAIDRPRHDPLIIAAHHDPSMLAFAEDVQRQFPYDPDAPWGAAQVIRTGQREVLTGIAEFFVPGAAERDVLARADVDSVVTVAIVGPLGVLGSLQLIRGRDRPPFSDAELELIDDLADRCGAAVHTAVLFARQASSRAALDTLQRFSGSLASAATRLDVARAVLTHSVAGIRASGAAMFVATAEGLRLLASDGLPSEAIDAIEHHAEAVMSRDGFDDRTVAVADGLHALVLPLRILSRTSGVVAFSFRDERTFADDEMSMMFTLVARAAGALERATLFERERETALVLQRRLLPDRPIVPDWLEAASRYEPAAQGRIGGDWYQLADAGPGRLLAVVGDAVGHGVASAAAMGQLRASIATAAASSTDLDTTLAVVDAFAAQGMDTIGATAAFACFDEAGSLRYGCAGHPPMVLMPADGPAVLLEGGRRPLLGFGAGTTNRLAESVEVPFRPGDLALMYTDGLVERRRESIDVGLARLARTVDGLRGAGPADLCDHLVAELEGSQTDDVAVLAIRRR
jgi:GAF domain-containing protein/PAS domain-containing protein